MSSLLLIVAILAWSLQMNEDLGLTATAFGFASSLFFFAYFLFEVPSNLAMQKFGAKYGLPELW